MRKFVVPAALSLAALMAVTGCASKQPIKKEEPQAAAAPTPEPKASYVVKRGDSLWKISGKQMGDAFRWPLIYKANRDQISDPDLIEPKMDLGYQKSYSSEEVSDAVKKAKETPPYVPHSAPRKSLPVKY